jgi:hypothetical protein
MGATSILTTSASAQFLPSPPGVPVAPYRYFTGQVLVSNLGTNYSLGFIRTTPLGNSYTYLPSAGYNPVYASQSQALRKARKQFDSADSSPERREIVTRMPDLRFDRSSPEFFEGLPTSFKSAVLTTTQEEILSGRAINDLLTTAIDLEKRGSRANGSYLSAELVTALRFAGNANADLSNWIHAGEIDYGSVFKSEAYATPRSWLKHDFGIVATNLLAGKTPDSSLYQGLVTAGKTFRRTFDEQKAKLSAADVKNSEQFLARYDAVVSIVRSPASTELGQADWSTFGVSVVELVGHCEKFKMRFGPVPEGREETYRALHKVLADYSVSLAEVRR